MSEILMMQSVGLGLVVSLVLSETLGLAAGGMVVPGYMALMIHDPGRIAGTILVSMVTYFTIMILSNYMFIYGRRRTVLIIIVGFLYGWLSREFLVFGFLGGASLEFQGVIQTLTTMLVAAVFVRLLLMIFTGGEVIS